jgi:nucleoside-diphosphate-sugar epimerase
LKAAIGIGRLFDIPAKLFSIDLPVNSERMRKLGTATYFTAEKAKKDGFVQKMSLKDSITEMCDWYLSINK